MPHRRTLDNTIGMRQYVNRLIGHGEDESTVVALTEDRFPRADHGTVERMVRDEITARERAQFAGGENLGQFRNITTFFQCPPGSRGVSMRIKITFEDRRTDETKTFYSQTQLTGVMSIRSMIDQTIRGAIDEAKLWEYTPPAAEEFATHPETDFHIYAVDCL